MSCGSHELDHGRQQPSLFLFHPSSIPSRPPPHPGFTWSLYPGCRWPLAFLLCQAPSKEARARPTVPSGRGGNCVLDSTAEPRAVGAAPGAESLLINICGISEAGSTREPTVTRIWDTSCWSFWYVGHLFWQRMKHLCTMCSRHPQVQVTSGCLP